MHFNLPKASRISASIKAYNQKTQLPYITQSFGMSLDGKIATVTGDSKYISGPISRNFVHQLRHQHDGILVGIQTVLIDHPLLTTRLPNQIGKDAHRIILDSDLRIDLSEPILHLQSAASTIIVHRATVDPLKAQKLRDLGVVLLPIHTNNRYLEIPIVLQKLYQLGIRSILVEGGSTVHYEFLKSRLVQSIYATLSPIIIGGDSAKSAVGGEGFLTLSEAPKLQIQSIRQYGVDYIIHAIPKEATNDSISNH